VDYSIAIKKANNYTERQQFSAVTECKNLDFKFFLKNLKKLKFGLWFLVLKTKKF